MSRTLVATSVATALLLAVPALALGPLDVTAGAGVHSKYVWRGQISTADPVLQPELNVGLLGMEIGVWANMDLTDINGYEASLSETDWSLGYEFSLPLVTLGAGFIYYDYPSRGPRDTFEFYVGAEAHVLLSPRLYIYNDLDAYKGTYVGAGITWDRELGRTTALQLAGDFGWGSDGYMNGYFGGSVGAGASDLTLAASLPWRALPLLTIEPYVSWATLLGGAKDFVDERDGDWNTVFFGVTAMVSF
jgi:hypothetical protein